MFSGNFKEEKSQVVTMQDIAFVGLKAVVESIYTAKIIRTVKTLPDILGAAHLMQMTGVVEDCKDWMLGNMQTSNCLTFLKYAEIYDLGPVRDAANEFVLRKFIDVSKTSQFLEISQASMCRYLSSDHLRTDFEEYEVYKVAKKWLEHNKIEDKKTVFEMMKNIRFALIASTELSQEIIYDDIIQFKDCQKLVSEAITYHMNLYQQPLYQGSLNQPRGKTGLILIPNGERTGNGFHTTDSGEDVHFMPFPEQTSLPKKDSSLKIQSVFNSLHSVQKNNFLFLFGVTPHGPQNYYMNFSKRYDSATNSWINLQILPKPTAVGMAIATDKENIYIMGGMPVNKESPFTLVDRPMSGEMYAYTIPSNTWSAYDPIPMKCSYCQATFLGENLYVSGGFDGGFAVSSVFSYDTHAKLWLTKKKMNHPRYSHIMEAVNDKLYVIGGLTGAGRGVRSVEIYDLPVDQWTVTVDSLSSGWSSQFQAVPSFVCSSFVYERKIYFVHDWQIAEYDPDQNQIRLLALMLPSDCQGKRVECALMNLPKLE